MKNMSLPRLVLTATSCFALNVLGIVGRNPVKTCCVGTVVMIIRAILIVMGGATPTLVYAKIATRMVMECVRLAMKMLSVAAGAGTKQTMLPPAL
jgi:hypothetical protein